MNEGKMMPVPHKPDRVVVYSRCTIAEELKRINQFDDEEETMEIKHISADSLTRMNGSEGLTNLLFKMDDVKLDVGKPAMWRL
jgi:hypothetical protein